MTSFVVSGTSNALNAIVTSNNSTIANTMPNAIDTSKRIDGFWNIEEGFATLLKYPDVRSTSKLEFSLYNPLAEHSQMYKLYQNANKLLTGVHCTRDTAWCGTTIIVNSLAFNKLKISGAPWPSNGISKLNVQKGLRMLSDLFTAERHLGFDPTNQMYKDSSGNTTGWITNWYDPSTNSINHAQSLPFFDKVKWSVDYTNTFLNEWKSFYLSMDYDISGWTRSNNTNYQFASFLNWAIGLHVNKVALLSNIDRSQINFHTVSISGQQLTQPLTTWATDPSGEFMSWFNVWIPLVEASIGKDLPDSDYDP